MNIYYVYCLIDPKDEKIFYIGKGKEKRAWIHFLPYKLKVDNHKNRKIKKIIAEGNFPIVKFLYENLDEEQAYNYETELIETIGLCNLTNCTPGGKGARLNKNFSGRKHTDETKDKMSKRQLGSNNSMAGDKWKRSEIGKETFAKKMTESRSGHTVSEETRTKISNSLTGFQWNDDEKEKRRKSVAKVWQERKLKGISVNKKRYIYISNDGTDKGVINYADISKKFNITSRQINKFIKDGNENYIIVFDYPNLHGL